MTQNKRFHPITWALAVKQADIASLVQSAIQERQKLMDEISRIQVQVRELTEAIEKAKNPESTIDLEKQEQ